MDILFSSINRYHFVIIKRSNKILSCPKGFYQEKLKNQYSFITFAHYMNIQSKILKFNGNDSNFSIKKYF